MRHLFKKTVITVLLCSMLFVLPACEPANSDKVATSNLDKYTIVYPAAYTDWQKEEITLLQNVIEHITGERIPAVADTEAEKDREIILASSSRQKGDVMNTVVGNMDYVITVQDGDIILGGKNYYADMRAVYDFVNNYLGYNDLENQYVEAVAEITGSKIERYTNPTFTIMASNPGKYPFSSAKDVKIMADAGFNMVKLDVYQFSEENFISYAKWCARFGVRIMQKAVFNVKTKEFNVNNFEISVSNPIMYGHYARYVSETLDFDRYSEMCDIYQEAYSQYGWKIAMNISSDIDATIFDDAVNNKEIFENADIVSIYNGISIGQDVHYIRQITRLNTLNILKNIAARNDNDVWFIINATDTSVASTPNSFRWLSYLALTYGASGIEYNLYKKGSVINDDYSKGDNYDNISIINKELIRMSQTYSQYKNLGLYVVNEWSWDPFINIEDQYDDFSNVIQKFSPPLGFDEESFIVGCFAAKDGSNKYAFTVVNLSPVSKINMSYPPSAFELNGSKITLYTNGEPNELSVLALTGDYRISISNGRGIFVTVE